MSYFERGFLTKPAVKKLLATWPDAEPTEAERIAANNDAIYRAAILKWFREGEPMQTRYGVRMADGLWWSYDNRFAEDPIAARWFQSYTAAELAALRELLDARSAWSVEPISLDGERTA